MTKLIEKEKSRAYKVELLVEEDDADAAISKTKSETQEAAKAIHPLNRKEISRIRGQSVRNPRAAIETGDGEGELGLTQFGAGLAIEFQVRTRFQLGRKIGPNLFLIVWDFWFLVEVLGWWKSGFFWKFWVEFASGFCFGVLFLG